MQPAVGRLRRGVSRLSCSTLERMITLRGGYDILVLLGMRRSGNHLAINWILHQTEGAGVFYNNIPAQAHPFSARRTEAHVHLPVRRSRIVLSYEDLSVEDLTAGPLPEFLNARQQHRDVTVRMGLMLRDPFNLFASRLKKWPERFADDQAIARQRALYLQHAKLAQSSDTVLGDIPVVPILYNRLVTDADYRRDLSARLGIADGEKGMDLVPTYGHGSSFDGMAASSQGIQNSVFDRWRHSTDDPRFRKAVDDPRLAAIAADLFDMRPQLT
jgi:hypothetical protein